MRRRELFPALAFLLPNILGFFVFTAGPVLISFLLSFAAWDLLTPARWIGGQNFIELIGFHSAPAGLQPNDPEFWRYLGNTLFMLLNLPFSVAGSLMLALLLNRKIRLQHLYRLAFFLPSILTGVAVFSLWKYLYNPEYGAINALLARLGLPGPKWLQDPAFAKPALMAMNVWTNVGGTAMVLYLAALQTVPLELYEAARIDGANTWARFRHVTWPVIAPVTFFIFIMGIIHGLQGGFEASYVMTNGGPYGATTTLGFYIYQKAYLYFEMGYASAIAWVLFLLTLAITLLSWRRAARRGNV